MNAVIIFKTDRPSSPTAIKTLQGWDLRGTSERSFHLQADMVLSVRNAG